jgi:hypothetical protein
MINFGFNIGATEQKKKTASYTGITVICDCDFAKNKNSLTYNYSQVSLCLQFILFWVKYTQLDMSAQQKKRSMKKE